jgi:hypothetical protein
MRRTRASPAPARGASRTTGLPRQRRRVAQRHRAARLDEGQDDGGAGQRRCVRIAQQAQAVLLQLYAAWVRKAQGNSILHYPRIHSCRSLALVAALYRTAQRFKCASRQPLVW